ncbi:MAG: hypothetical protein WKF59_06715 [Chitinophagaceae bacterium]
MIFLLELQWAITLKTEDRIIGTIGYHIIEKATLPCRDWIYATSKILEHWLDE